MRLPLLKTRLGAKEPQSEVRARGRLIEKQRLRSLIPAEQQLIGPAEPPSLPNSPAPPLGVELFKGLAVGALHHYARGATSRVGSEIDQAGRRGSGHRARWPRR